MKNQKILLLFALVLTLLNSCQQDSFIEDLEFDNESQNAEIQLKSYDEESCGVIDDLCLSCVILMSDNTGGVRLPDLSNRQTQTVEGIDNNYLEIIINGDTYTIRPARYFDEQTQEYLISTPTGNYIVSNIENNYVRSKALDVELPDVLQNVYELDHKRFVDGLLDFDEIQGAFGQNVQLEHAREEGYTITTTGTFLSSNLGTIGVYDPCFGITMSALVLEYQEVLGMNDPHTNAEQIIENALNINTPANFDPKTNCLNTQDVVESILNDPLIAGSPFARFLIKLNYLSVLLNLSDDEYNQLQPFANQGFVDMLYAELNNQTTSPNCQNADCALKQAVESLVGFHLYSGETVLTADIQNTVDFHEYLYCQNNALFRATERFGACGQQYITLFLRDNSLSYADLEVLLEKYDEARDVYYGSAYGPAGIMGQRLQEQGVSWCDMIEITNVMYEDALGLPAFAPDAAEGRSEAVGPVLLLFKAAGEGFGDALAQAFFIWIADNGKEGFTETIVCINAFESTVAFFKGLIPWKATTNQQVAAHLTVDAAAAMIVVMDRAIKQDDYTWEQAGIDYATTFAAYVAGDIFGAGFAKYGAVLAKGIIKKLNHNPNGFFGISFGYARISKWLGGGVSNTTPYPPFSYTHPQFGFTSINPVKMMKEWELTDEIFIIGRGVDSRIEPYKAHLQSLGFNVKSICDNPLWDCANFNPAIHTVE